MKKIEFKKAVEQVLFSSRWILVPFYLGLLIALCKFLYLDIKQVFEFVDDEKAESVMPILELIDMAMIASLVRMIIIGGYTSFVCKKHSMEDEKSSSGVLKVKLGTALIGVSSIHLLQSFIKCASDKTITWDVINMQLLIHLSFLLGAIVLAIVDYLHVKAEAIHHTDDEIPEIHKKEEAKPNNHVEASRH